MASDISVKRSRQFNIPFKTLSHVKVGGATTGYMIYYIDPKLLPPKITSIRRYVKHFVEWGRMGSSNCPSNVTPLTGSDLLNTSHPLQVIRVPSRFDPTKHVFRTLELDELSFIYGIPLKYHKTITIDIFNYIIPLHLLDSLLLPNLPRQSYKRKGEMLILPTPTIDPRGVWLPDIKHWMPHKWFQNSKSGEGVAKNDDADIPIHYWDNRITTVFPTSTLSHCSVLRQCSLIMFRRRLRKDVVLYSQSPELKMDAMVSIKQRGGTYGSQTDVDRMVGSLKALLQRTLIQSLKATILDWSAGSTLYFWRWPIEIRYLAIWGIPPYIVKSLPRNKKPARRPKSNIYEPLIKKMKKFLQRGYLTLVPFRRIKSLIDYFAVPKGTSDIRVVFNGTSCGLTDSLWSPNFWLPNANSLLRSTTFGSKFVDIDLGEMFYNFPLHESLIYHSGVDLTPFKRCLLKDTTIQPLLTPEIVKERRLGAVWNRTWMGLKCSPEHCVRFYYLIEEFLLVNPLDPDNPLAWDTVVLNLIGNDNYNPSLPNVFKWNSRLKQMAGDIKAYVDDLRAIGCSLEHAWKIARAIASRLQYLGVQDAPRKRRCDNGPWAGTIFHTDNKSVQKTVEQKKWDKAKSYLKFLSDHRDTVKDYKQVMIDYKKLESIRGFLIHLAMTYEVLFPYLKGFHLTLAQHLAQRDEEGWKLEGDTWDQYIMNKVAEGELSVNEAEELNGKSTPPHPQQVIPVPLFWECLDTMNMFFTPEHPPKVTDRSKDVSLVLYGYADASKQGFGSMIESPTEIRYRIGTWGSDTEDQSSNWREFTNVVESLEAEALAGNLYNSTVIIATDNTTVEGVYYKGNSKSKTLYDLVVRLRTLELTQGLRLYVTHVAGERMKSQGTDGLSCGHTKEGVCIGETMSKYCPWGMSPCSRSSTWTSWLKTWLPEGQVLTPNDWFTKGHDHNGGYVDPQGFWRLHIKKQTHIWDIPPAAGDAAVEELRKARLKRQNSTHVFLIPKLFTHLWQKQLLKACDILIKIPPGHPFWSHDQFEPLFIGICFPFLSFAPWQLRHTPRLFAMERTMCKLLQNYQVDSRNILCKFLLEVRSWYTMPESMVWSLLFFKPKDFFPCSSSRPTPTQGRKRRRPKSVRVGLEEKTSSKRRLSEST